jgi:thiol-disulfide isomerase/thioredoxin
MRARRRRVVVWGIALAVVAGLLAVGLSHKRATAEEPAPALPHEALVGRPVTLAALLGEPGATPIPGRPAAPATDTAENRTTGAQDDTSTGGARGAGVQVGSGAGRAHAALVLFWASDCEPCQREAAAVERFARSPAGRGRIVGIDYGESESAAPRAFLRRYGWSFPNLDDLYGRAGEAYGLAGLPSTYVIDARGRIAATLRGPQTVQSLTRALAGAEA